MTTLADRAAQMSPQARELLARELIRVGTAFPVDAVAEPVAVVGSDAGSPAMSAAPRACGAYCSTAWTRSARCPPTGGMPMPSTIPTRKRPAG